LARRLNSTPRVVMRYLANIFGFSQAGSAS
jgi:hypothetical protein